MSSSFTVKLDKRGLRLIRKETAPRAQKLLDKSAFDIAAHAIRKVRVDTGATKASIYVAGASGATGFLYSVRQALAAALAKASGRRGGMWFHEEVQPKDKWERVIGASTWYAIFVENRHEPFLRPAAIAVGMQLKRQWRELFSWL